MTKYLVTMNSVGYGRFGDPRQELLCEEVDSTELYRLLADMAALADSEMAEKPSQALENRGNSYLMKYVLSVKRNFSIRPP